MYNNTFLIKFEKINLSFGYTNNKFRNVLIIGRMFEFR